MDALSPVNDFYTDDAWQKTMRERFFVPHYRETFAAFGFLDGDREFDRAMQKHGIDTIVLSHVGATHTIEEKIARYKGKVYDAIAVETRSCTLPGMEKDGWIITAKAEFLLYGIETAEGDLDTLLVDMNQLKSWFAENYQNYPPHVMPDKNRSECRIVKINDIMAGVPKCRRFLLKAAPLAPA